MAADVTTGQGGEEQKQELVTRDLLGGGVVDEKELWERKLDLLSRTSTSNKKTRSDPVDLNLPPPPAPSFASVCTLEKVKSALERAMGKPNPEPTSDPKPDSSMKRRTSEKVPVDGQDSSSGDVTGRAMIMTSCPGCFQYLLVPVADPRCPRCDVQVPVKRARIGVN